MVLLLFAGRKGDGGPKPTTPSDDSSQQSVPGPSQSDFPSLGETQPQRVEPVGRGRRPREQYGDVKPGTSAEKQEYPSLDAAGGVQPYSGAGQRDVKREEQMGEGRRFDKGDGRTPVHPKSDRGRGRGKTQTYQARSGPGGDVSFPQPMFPPLGGDRQGSERQSPEQISPSVSSVSMTEESGRGRGMGRGGGRGMGRGGGRSREMQRTADPGVSKIEETMAHMQIKQDPVHVATPQPKPYIESRPRQPQQQEVKMPSPVTRAPVTPEPSQSLPPQEAKKQQPVSRPGKHVVL